MSEPLPSPEDSAAPVARIAVRVGDPAPRWRVGGRPLLGRLTRQLAARGVTHAELRVTGGVDATERLVRAAGRDLQVTVVDSDGASDDAACFQGGGLYDAADLDAWVAGGPVPEPAVRVTNRASRGDAERRVWAGIRKSLSHDGPVAYYLARPLATPITRLLARTGARPNGVTLVGLLVGVACGVVASFGGYAAGLAAAGLFFVGLLLDCVDGDLARVTLTTSRLGQWLDTITDDLGYAALAVGVGIGLTRVTGEPLWQTIGWATLGLLVVGQGVIYVWLQRSGGPIDTARYPWFFMGDEGLAQESERGLVGWLSFAVRRDSLTLYFLVLAAVDLQWGILLALAGGSAVYFALLGIDLVAKARRRPA